MLNNMNNINQLKINVSEMKSLCKKLNINFTNYNVQLSNNITQELSDTRYDEGQQNSQWLNSNNCVIGENNVIINYDSDTNSEIEYIPTKKLITYNNQPNLANVKLNKNIFLWDNDI